MATPPRQVVDRARDSHVICSLVIRSLVITLAPETRS